MCMGALIDVFSADIYRIYLTSVNPPLDFQCRIGVLPDKEVNGAAKVRESAQE